MKYICKEDLAKEWKLTKKKCKFKELPCSECLLGKKEKSYMRVSRKVDKKKCERFKRKKLTIERVKNL